MGLEKSILPALEKDKFVFFSKSLLSISHMMILVEDKEERREEDKVYWEKNVEKKNHSHTMKTRIHT